MTTTNPQPSYEVRIVWQHGDIEVQHHFEASDPRFEVRQAGTLKYIFVATRGWQAERRMAVEAAADLAGVEPPTSAAPVQAPAGLRPEKTLPAERITSLVYALAELFYEENPARTHRAIVEQAQEVVYATIAQGYRAFTDLEAEVQMGVNRWHFDFEAEGREKLVIYNRF